MNKILALAVTMCLVGCGDTINNNYYGDPDGVAEEDVFAEDDVFYADTNVEPDESTPPTEDVEEEWAPGCNPQHKDGVAVHCGESLADFCILLWDKQECTAACWSEEWSSFLFQKASEEAVFDPNDLDCSLI